MSTKRAVGRFRQVIDTAKSKKRDPRFDEVSAGTFRQELFDRSYGFLDEKRDQEITKLKKAVSKERRKRKGREGLPESKIETLKAALIRLKQDRGERQRAKVTTDAIKNWKQTEKAKVATGKKPFFLKKKEKNRVQVEHQFETLRSGPGGARRVGKLIEKRQKKIASKDRKRGPGDPTATR